MDDGPCWGAWRSTWDGVRDNLRRDLDKAKVALALAERLNEDTSRNPCANADRRQSAAFDLKCALKHLKSLEAALKLLPCEAYEVATTQYKWQARGLQKALSHLAHAHAYNALHKKYIDAGDRIAAATLLSTAAPGALAWVTFNDLSHKPVTLSRDDFRTAMRFSLGIDLPNLTVAAENQTACGHCGSSFPSAKRYQVHALVE